MAAAARQSAGRISRGIGAGRRLTRIVLAVLGPRFFWDRTHNDDCAAQRMKKSSGLPLRRSHLEFKHTYAAFPTFTFAMSASGRDSLSIRELLLVSLPRNWCF